MSNRSRGEGEGFTSVSQKRWHSDMIAEVINLNLRERGALFTLVNLMYIHGGSVPDEDDFMRRCLGCNAKGWHTLPRSASSSSENLPGRQPPAAQSAGR